MAFTSPYDGIVMIDPQPDGSIICEHVGGNPHAYTHVLIETESGAEVFRPFEKGNQWIVDSVRSSYGMNSASAQLVGRANHVLCLDYRALVVDVVGSPPRGLMTWPSDAAERHRNTLNVLFADGRVAVPTAQEIDPAVAANQTQLWQP